MTPSTSSFYKKVNTTDLAVELEGVEKRFGPKVAVCDLALIIEKGAVFGLIGPNGAGKTTTFSLICGYIRPNTGKIRVLGHLPGTLPVIKGKIGALPQDALLPANDKVGELLTYYGRLMGLSRSKALQAAKDSIERVGMSQCWQMRCGALSHGMAKRVGLAQAFLGNPPLILLDEPTAGLDPKSAFLLRDYIKQQRKSGQTIIISSHNLQELEELCNFAAILNQGRLITCGSMEQLTRSAGEIRIVLANTAPIEELEKELEKIPCIGAIIYDQTNKTLVIDYSPSLYQAEDVISEALKFLLAKGIGVSSVSRGRKLEERVIELT
jgi:ABC-type multidrug transport system ATPase subunit